MAVGSKLLTPSAQSLVRTLGRSLKRTWGGIRNAHADLIELEERRLLLQRPWQEQFLHWVHDGERWHLHGHRTPPRGGPHSVTTRDGWCPGQR